MAIRISLFAVPTVAVVGLVVLLNALDASAGIAVAALGLVAIVSGAALGVFADRLPELPSVLRRHDNHPTGLAGVHHAGH
jgi:hypothetical protein